MLSATRFSAAVFSLLSVAGYAVETPAQHDEKIQASVAKIVDQSNRNAEKTLIPAWLPVLENPTSATLTEKQKQVVRTGVTASLKDPTSARFGSSFVAAKGTSGRIVVCGFVNAKNSFGGYVGEAPFIGLINSAGDNFHMDHLGTTNMENIVMLNHCEHLDRSPSENLGGKGALINAMYRGH